MSYSLREHPIKQSVLVDADGSDLKYVDGQLRTLSKPYEYEIVDGNIDGRVPWVKTGYNGDADIGVESLWAVGGLYVFPSGASQMKVYSSHANDNAAGAGVRTLTVGYLDALYGEHTEDITLNGLSGVTVVATDMLRINSFRAKTAGVSNQAIGNIDIVALLPATTIYSRMAAGSVRARNVAYTVPAGKNLHVTSSLFSIGGVLKNVTYSGKFMSMSNYDPVNQRSLTFQMAHTELLLMDAAKNKPFELPTKLDEGVDMITNVECYTDNCICMVAHRGYLVTV